jgi:dihydrofolate reductase
MRKIISFNHLSLDGFVAGPNGEMNWITLHPELFSHVDKRISQGDSALYGRVTYQMMEGYWPTAADKPNPSQHEINHSSWYKGIRKIVLSKTLSEEGLSNTLLLRDNLAEQITAIKQESGPEILLFGSPSATHSLLELGLIDGFWLFVNPVVLGKGIPLFTNVREKLKLQLVGSHRFDFGVHELDYVVERP